MEQCDDTASPNDESPSENADSQFDPNYSINADSYSDTSDSNNSPLHEVKVSALNETQNLDLTQGEKTRSRIAEKEREPFNQNGKEIKTNCFEIQDTQTETFKKY